MMPSGGTNPVGRTGGLAPAWEFTGLRGLGEPAPDGFGLEAACAIAGGVGADMEAGEEA